MFTYTKTIVYKKTVTKTAADGKVTEEVTETCEGPEAAKKAEKMSEEANKEFAKMDQFFKKIDEAFKLL